jgi:hypothetical protein
LAVTSVEAGRDHRVTEAEGSALEHIADSRVYIGFVAFVFAERFTNQGR